MLTTAKIFFISMLIQVSLLGLRVCGFHEWTFRAIYPAIAIDQLRKTGTFIVLVTKKSNDMLIHIFKMLIKNLGIHLHKIDYNIQFFFECIVI